VLESGYWTLTLIQHHKWDKSFLEIWIGSVRDIEDLTRAFIVPKWMIASGSQVAVPFENRHLSALQPDGKFSGSSCKGHVRYFYVLEAADGTGNIHLDHGRVFDIVIMPDIPDPDQAVGMGHLRDISILKPLHGSFGFGASGQDRRSLPSFLPQA
jgi:hypothetical protein